MYQEADQASQSKRAQKPWLLALGSWPHGGLESLGKWCRTEDCTVEVKIWLCWFGLGCKLSLSTDHPSPASCELEAWLRHAVD